MNAPLGNIPVAGGFDGEFEVSLQSLPNLGAGDPPQPAVNLEVKQQLLPLPPPTVPAQPGPVRQFLFSMQPAAPPFAASLSWETDNFDMYPTLAGSWVIEAVAQPTAGGPPPGPPPNAQPGLALVIAAIITTYQPADMGEPWCAAGLVAKPQGVPVPLPVEVSLPIIAALQGTGTGPFGP